MEAIKMITILFVALSLQTLTDSLPLRGHWKLLKSSIGISAMHMALMPSGRVVLFDRTDLGRSNFSLPASRCHNISQYSDCSAHSVEFDPATRGVRPLNLLTDTFCSSGGLSPNGTLIQSGGYNNGDHVVRYLTNCTNCDWTEDRSGLTVRRWYATDHVLPDGRLIVVGGRRQFNYEFIPKSTTADFTTFALQLLWDTTDEWENNLYPFVHLSSNGHLFIFANTRSVLLNYTSNQVVREFPEMPSGVSRNYPSSGSSVLLPLVMGNGSTRAEVMICGGTLPKAIFWAAKRGVFLPASRTCGRLVISDESPAWEMEEMPMGRVMGDMVMLPTGDVLIVNGAATGSAGWENAREPVMNPVLYRTDNRTFEIMAASNIPRLYHSTAVLLPDGRVLVGGSNPHRLYEFSGVEFPTDLSLEAFYPPYMTSGRRPRVMAVRPGVEVGYWERMEVVFAVAEGVAPLGVKVTMVAPSFCTHSFSMNQRLVVMEVEAVRHVGGRRWAVEVVAPSGTAVAPPGYYMVFVVHEGVPSRGVWIRIS